MPRIKVWILFNSRKTVTLNATDRKDVQRLLGKVYSGKLYVYLGEVFEHRVYMDGVMVERERWNDVLPKDN